MALPYSQCDAAGTLLQRGVVVRFRSRGGSMYPTFEAGETLLVEPVIPAGVRWRDVVLYRVEDGLLAQRVVRRGVRRRRFCVRGDALTPSRSIAAANLVGRVVSVERGDRWRDLAARRSKLFDATRCWVFRAGRWLTRRWQGRPCADHQ